MTSLPASAARPRPFRGRLTRRWLMPALALAVLVALGFALRPQPAPAETARAARGSLRATVSEEGKTRIRQRYAVSAPVTGLLQRIPFKPGAVITARETVVAVIEPAPASPLDARNRALAEARRAAAAAALERTRKALELARSELGRVERMFAERTVSPADLESAQMRENAAALEVTAAEGSLRVAEAELAHAPDASAHPAPVEVRAPVSGTVLHVFQESTRVVGQGTPLLEIGDPADLEVVVEMLSRDAAALRPGAPVELEQWGGGEVLQAKVRLVEPAAFTKISALGVEEQRVYVVADFVSPREQWAALGDNYRVEAHAVVWQSDGVLKVHAGALFRQGRDWAAYVVHGGRAVLRPVQPGRSSGTETQVLQGLAEGDEVILYPGERIRDGQRVRVVNVSG